VNADDFRKQVYCAVRAIPIGMVATYGMIAAALDRPRDARQVGRALYVCRDVDVPCHRVVNRNGVLTGAWAFETPIAQMDALVSEGVTFDGFGRVNMAVHKMPHGVLETALGAYLLNDPFREDL
jgi:O-6-methylguanine DNA methyltransferase